MRQAIQRVALAVMVAVGGLLSNGSMARPVAVAGGAVMSLASVACGEWNETTISVCAGGSAAMSSAYQSALALGCAWDGAGNLASGGYDQTCSEFEAAGQTALSNWAANGCMLAQ